MTTWFRILRDVKQGAAVLAALCVWAGSATAQEITITSDQGALSLTGRLIGFDGTHLQIESAQGPLTVAYDRVRCDGAACPPRQGFVPRVRFSGAAHMAEVLIPGLVHGFARARGWQVSEEVGAGGLTLRLSDGDTLMADFAMRARHSEEGFADLIAHEADVVMSLREILPAEIARAAEAGIADLGSARQSFVVALDGLVPVISPTRELDALSLQDMADVLTGAVEDWAQLGAAPGPVHVHLLARADGQAERFLAGPGMPPGGPDGDWITRHETAAALAQAVALDPDALGLVALRDALPARALGLRDACGFQAEVTDTTLKSEDYPLTAPVFLYVPDWRLPQVAHDFMAWLSTPAARLVVRRAGYTDPAPVPVPLDAQGQRFVSAIANAGPEVSLEELQRMVGRLDGRTRLSLTFRFEVGSTRLDALSRANLGWLTAEIAAGRWAGRDVLFAGFSDGLGEAGANRTLSAARAEAVVDRIRDALDGFPDNVRVQTAAFGEALPMACDDTEWGRQTNRRVEVWLAD